MAPWRHVPIMCWPVVEVHQESNRKARQVIGVFLSSLDMDVEPKKRGVFRVPPNHAMD